MLRIVLMGPPGAGKGTQAKEIAKIYDIPHISTGDILRQNIKNGTALGEKAKAYIEKGQLVPDEVTLKILHERVMEQDCENGYILDGFPRNLNQARALDKCMMTRNEHVSMVLLIDAKPEIITERISGRRVCKRCGAVYHISQSPSRKSGVCDTCGGELYQREDDREETVKKRLDVYSAETAPLINYYEQAGSLVRVDGTREIGQVLEDIKHILEEYLKHDCGTAGCLLNSKIS